MQTENRDILESLAASQTFRDFRDAFTMTTGLPLTLRPVEAWQPPLRGASGESPFCAMLCAEGRYCTACQRAQEQLTRRATRGGATMECWCGLTVSAVPIILDAALVGFLETGQVFRAAPQPKAFAATIKRLRSMHEPMESPKLRQAFFATRVMPVTRFRGCVSLLKVFASYLTLVGEQLVVRARNSEPEAIRRAKEIIRERHAEHLRLSQVAQAVNASMFHFCKNFHRVTGVSFSRYLCEVRLEKARNLLLNPDLKVSEIAYAVGFQSLTHFNRVFKSRTGFSPTQYRVRAVDWEAKATGAPGAPAKAIRA